MPHFIDRAKPGVIAVTPKGKRFTNEGNSYHDFVQAMVAANKGEPEVSAWLLCDHRVLRNYGLGCVAPFPLPIGRHLKSGYLKRGATIGELARQIGVEPAVLQATVDEFNRDARKGEDPAFGKGSKAYNRYQGDELITPNPCVAPLETGPFYAIKLVVGDIGTFAGLVTDEKTRVLDAHGQPDQGPVRGRQRRRQRHGRQLPRRRHHAGPGADLRLHRRPAARRRRGVGRGPAEARKRKKPVAVSRSRLSASPTLDFSKETP